jgi:hypothetical protein
VYNRNDLEHPHPFLLNLTCSNSIYPFEEPSY